MKSHFSRRWWTSPLFDRLMAIPVLLLGAVAGARLGGMAGAIFFYFCVALSIGLAVSGVRHARVTWSWITFALFLLAAWFFFSILVVH